MSRIDRREVLAAAGSTLAAVLAGCQGGGADRSTTATTAETPTETAGDADATTTADAADPKRRAREFVGLIDEGAYERAHDRFNQTAAEQISPDQLAQLWTGLEDQLGDFLSLSELETVDQDGVDVVTGIATFENGRREVEISFGPEGIAGFWIRRVTGEWSAPSYADESAFTERAVSLEATDDCTLDGTLTVPEGVEEAPGVVLVHGQGPSDRDGTVGPNKPYKDLAWGLASRGVAVLRYDKRTQACDVDFADVTIDEAVTDDALTAIERLRETDAVAADDVVVAGHSIGATLAPRIAARDGDLAGVVMLAPLARTVTEAITDQSEYLAERDGTVTDAERDQLDQAERIVEQIRSGNITDEEVVYLGGDEYWRSLREYDAVAAAAEIDAPRLVLQGERDYQVTVEEDLAEWREALGEDPGVSFRTYPRLNHLFMPGEGKPGRGEYFRENHVAKAVVTDVASFAAEVTAEGTTTVE
ncbi:alpha/beta hydrolase [Halorussus marinus]|uniref:alpha/beta hydrolase n=1 Tax=Halorussus marinus TaxID=2505976 RepID=UPI0010919AF0|nr:alpha/beta fold hydrolase [Halorussus marinus]